MAHIAVSLGSRDAVDRLVAAMRAAGVAIARGPRVTGDGYYEAVVSDTEGNLVEITAKVDTDSGSVGLRRGNDSPK
jgi:lactoylglutathione lyase